MMAVDRFFSAVGPECAGGNEIIAVDGSQQLSNIIRTNIGTHHFTSYERLIIAVTDDDVVALERLAIPLEELSSMEFEGGHNILNFAIEQERVAIVKHLASATTYRPEIREKLLNHRYGKDKTQAIH